MSLVRGLGAIWLVTEKSVCILYKAREKEKQIRWNEIRGGGARRGCIWEMDNNRKRTNSLLWLVQPLYTGMAQREGCRERAEPVDYVFLLVWKRKMTQRPGSLSHFSANKKTSAKTFCGFLRFFFFQTLWNSFYLQKRSQVFFFFFVFFIYLIKISRRARYLQVNDTYVGGWHRFLLHWQTHWHPAGGLTNQISKEFQLSRGSKSASLLATIWGLRKNSYVYFIGPRLPST